jgi:hypothetical protein
LQTASCNLRHTTFEAQKATDVVIDPKTVDRTCLNGPQWFARDFAGPVQEQKNGVAPVASAEAVQAEASQEETRQAESCRGTFRPAHARPDKARPDTIRADKRKRPEPMAVEEGPSLARHLLQKFFPQGMVANDDLEQDQGGERGMVGFIPQKTGRPELNPYS